MVWAGAERVVEARSAKRKNRETIMVSEVSEVRWMYVGGARNMG